MSQLARRSDVDDRFLHGVPPPPDYFKNIAADVIIATGNPNIRRNARKIAYQLLNLGLFVIAGTMSAVWGIEGTDDTDVDEKEEQEKKKKAKIERLRAIARDASTIACTYAAHVSAFASTSASDVGIRATCRRATSVVIYATRAMYDEVLTLSIVDAECDKRVELYPCSYA